MEPAPRTILFSLWTGEEPRGGDSTMGSLHYVENPVLPLAQMRAYVNLDMIGRTSPRNRSNRAHIVGGFAVDLPAFEQIIRGVNDRTIRWPLV